MFVSQLHSISCLLTMSILFCATYCTLSMTEPMEWVRKMTSIRNRAEEIVEVEMI